ncbi:GNAT family N-acetyltransferase [Maribacter confluentis]|uniref:GNAT family N-acetyltransferase n=1 Tax=Maribacter confluentis TaxID=1656093 RepID=A0ABT8RS82_9FLAO|nr:GNAT family N-acetyltransferase [Maribacter confluentis]MDO1513784.1 GNAT family N-acetyltransferase [Maribacter confluentis]
MVLVIVVNNYNLSLQQHNIKPNYLLTNEETDRLLIKKVTQTHFQEWLPFHKEPLSSQFWSGLPKDPIQACQEQFNRIFERYDSGAGGMNALIHKESNMLIGLAGLLIQNIDHQEELEIGYSILPKYWRQGYAFEAASACKNVAFQNNWAESLISIIQVNNLPSQRTALKIGMSIDGSTTYKKNPVNIFRIRK